MAETISVRLDDDAQRALAELEATGLTRSEAVRTGLQSAARQLRDRRQLLQEAELLAGDDDDVAEAHAVQRMMEDLRAAW
jgi:antitoxin component of RelBE/YafQ-DinJ toxin-antitoxin module